MRHFLKGVAIVGIGFCLAVTAACEIAGIVERARRR
jgi:hypothetical protein